MKLGHFVEAIECFDRVLEIAPQDAGALYNKGYAQEKLGRKLEAAVSYRKFLEVAPVQYARQIAIAFQRLRELEKR